MLCLPELYLCLFYTEFFLTPEIKGYLKADSDLPYIIEIGITSVAVEISGTNYKIRILTLFCQIELFVFTLNRLFFCIEVG